MINNKKCFDMLKYNMSNMDYKLYEINVNIINVRTLYGNNGLYGYEKEILDDPKNMVIHRYHKIYDDSEMDSFNEQRMEIAIDITITEIKTNIVTKFKIIFSRQDDHEEIYPPNVSIIKQDNSEWIYLKSCQIKHFENDMDNNFCEIMDPTAENKIKYLVNDITDYEQDNEINSNMVDEIKKFKVKINKQFINLIINKIINKLTQDSNYKIMNVSYTNKKNDSYYKIIKNEFYF